MRNRECQSAHIDQTKLSKEFGLERTRTVMLHQMNVRSQVVIVTEGRLIDNEAKILGRRLVL